MLVPLSINFAYKEKCSNDALFPNVHMFSILVFLLCLMSSGTMYNHLVLTNKTFRLFPFSCLLNVTTFLRVYEIQIL